MRQFTKGDPESLERHQCTICKKVRYEKYMCTEGMRTRWQNLIWYCLEDCRTSYQVKWREYHPNHL